MSNPQVGSAKSHDLDSFLGHETRGGGGASFLGNWKKRDGAKVRVLLHTRAGLISVHEFQWPKIKTREIDGVEVTAVWKGSFNSWETEDVLKNQYFRNDEGERKYPPQICPMAIMLEEVDRLMREGKLPWHTLMFEFKGDDKEYDQKLFAGAITNKVKKIYDPKSKTPDDEKRVARKKGFPGVRDAWKTNLMSKVRYILTVLDFENPDDGIQIANETQSVGDKLKKVIRDRRTSEGEDEGNPLLNPYVLQISHHPDAEQFDRRYDVVPIGKLKPTDEMIELIKDKDPPNLERITAPGDIVALRASMEDHYVGPPDLLDFDYIFAKAEALAGIEAEDSSDDEGDDTETEEDEAAERDGDDAAPAEEPQEPEEDEKPDRIIVKRKGNGADQQCFAADGMELYGCEKCQAIMRADETACYNCGEEYGEEPDPEPDPEPPPPPARRRSGAAKTKPAAKDGVGF